MNGNNRPIGDRHTSLDTLAAKLTDAAYSVALRHERRSSWVDLELDLWRALGETVQRWLPQVAGHRQAVPVPVRGAGQRRQHRLPSY
jgi:hypothetical protein